MEVDESYNLSFANFQKMKYTNSEKVKNFIEKDYKTIESKIFKNLPLYATEHLLVRANERGVKKIDILHTLKNPLDRKKPKQNVKGMWSYKLVGKYSTIYINPITKKITTTHKTHTKDVKDYE